MSLELKEKIKLYLESCGISDSEIARRIGVNRVSVGKWRQTGNISKDNLFKLCKELEISEQVFFIDKPMNEMPQKKLLIIKEIIALENKDFDLLNKIEDILNRK
jgi:transcriptional regulator with XRE-family HTH domain